MNTAEWLRAARKHAGLTQEQAGALVGCGKGNWSAWEKNRHSPSIQQVARVSEAFNYPLPEGLGDKPVNLSSTEVNTRSEANVTESEIPSRSGVSQLGTSSVVSYSRRVPVTGTATLREHGHFEVTNAMGAMDGFVQAQTADDQAYALRVRGDQMAPAIRDGWYVVVSPMGAPVVGEYVCVTQIDGTRMFRELLYERADTFALMEVNSEKRQTLERTSIQSIYPVISINMPSQWSAT